jgi:hypothetical protein
MPGDRQVTQKKTFLLCPKKASDNTGTGWEQLDVLPVYEASWLTKPTNKTMGEIYQFTEDAYKKR